MLSFFRGLGAGGKENSVGGSSPPPSPGSYEYGPGSAYLQPGEHRGGTAPFTEEQLNGAAPFTDSTAMRPSSPSAPGWGGLPKIRYAGGTPRILLKLRKEFHPLKVTRLSIGMDVDLKTRNIGYKWSWTDRLIGAHLTVDRHEAALTKRFSIAEMNAHFDVRAALDLASRKTLFSLNVRPFPGVVAAGPNLDGIAVRKRIPLEKRCDVEVFARLKMPEARFSSSNRAPVSLGEGDFVVHVDQLNFRFVLQ